MFYCCWQLKSEHLEVVVVAVEELLKEKAVETDWHLPWELLEDLWLEGWCSVQKPQDQVHSCLLEKMENIFKRNVTFDIFCWIRFQRWFCWFWNIDVGKLSVKSSRIQSKLGKPIVLRILLGKDFVATMTRQMHF